MEAKEEVLGRTCLITATQNGHLAICRLLIDNGAQVEVRDIDGRTPLHYAAQGHVDIVRLLCDHGAVIDARQEGGVENGYTCLLYAARHNHLDICRFLIENGANMEARGISGMTSLHCAAALHKIDILRLFWARGANIETLSDIGWRPLHYAVSNGYILIVRELIEVMHADINADAGFGRTAFRLATDKGHINIAAYLALHGGVDGGPIEDNNDVDGDDDDEEEDEDNED